VEKVKDMQKNQIKAMEKEREYWEARGPLEKGARGRINEPVPKENRSSFLSVRLSGKELTQLRDLADRYNLGPSTFARQALVSLIGNAEALKNRNIEPKKILFDEICDALVAKTPQMFREQLMNLLLSSTEGELENPSSIIIDKSKMRECLEMSVKFMSLLAETVNPDIKVVTPFDSNYEKEKESQESTRNLSAKYET
jgi:hypothetical protein